MHCSPARPGLGGALISGLVFAAIWAASAAEIRIKAVDYLEGRKHWAFQPVGHPRPPLLDRDSWSANGIDKFILQKLRAAGLQPSPEADRRTLIRRACMALTGLPPTQEEVANFVADPAADAYPKLVERLLNSPCYGEKWARHWLDIARYSDTKGYVYAREEKSWVHSAAYRDWVVQAFNRDLPYDRFLLLQIAADQVVPDDSPDLAAMGFLTLGRRFLGVTHDIIDDRIDVVMRGTQALTVACARCHDHKFDPIGTADYYSLYGVFQSCAEKLVPCGPVNGDAAFRTELHTRTAKLIEAMRLRRGEQEARVRSTVKEHLLAQLELEKYPEEAFGQLLDEHDLNPFIVRRWQNFLQRDERSADPVFADWHALVQKGASRADFEETAFAYAQRFAAVEKRWSKFRQQHPDATGLPDSVDERLRRVLFGADSPCVVPDEHIANIEMYFPNKVVTELWKLQGEVDRWLLQGADAPAYATILVDRPQPATPRIFKRGNPLTKGDEVPRQYLPVLAPNARPKPFSKGSGRLELAQQIIAPDNPLTARVLVNRVWQELFGRGLVTTASDFGARADPPSHPELLDWLARSLMDEGWSIKTLQRNILLSATWRQDSSRDRLRADTDLRGLEVDAANTLLWRMNTHRLSFEEARDAWLATSLELDLRIGGKPSALFDSRNQRRTLYALIDREKLPAVMRTFDFANPDLSIPQRTDTIVPQQALFGLNHPFLMTRAKTIARQLEHSLPRNQSERVRAIYQRLFQREPSADELAAALEFVQSAPDSRPEPKTESLSWLYGIGEMDEASGRVKNFTRLPYFNGHAWQGGENWPDTKLGWAQLTATGGHPGNDRKHAVIRRWVAPKDGFYSIESTLVHQPTAGDGIRAFVSHNRLGLLLSANAHGSTSALNMDSIAMNSGDILDFVIDIGNGLNNDQFLWSPVIRASGSAGSGGDTSPAVWSASQEFSGPPLETVDPWSQLVQTLLLSNEFLFVD